MSYKTVSDHIFTSFFFWGGGGGYKMPPPPIMNDHSLMVPFGESMRRGGLRLEGRHHSPLSCSAKDKLRQHHGPSRVGAGLSLGYCHT